MQDLEVGLFVPATDVVGFAKATGFEHASDGRVVGGRLAGRVRAVGLDALHFGKGRAVFAQAAANPAALLHRIEIVGAAACHSASNPMAPNALLLTPSFERTDVPGSTPASLRPEARSSLLRILFTFALVKDYLNKSDFLTWMRRKSLILRRRNFRDRTYADHP